MKDKWAIRDVIVAEPVVSDKKVSDHELLDAIFKLRGVKDPSELQYDIKNMIDPYLMKGMDEAVELLIEAIENDYETVVIGDFDCDGATATTIALSGLKMLGMKKISFLIPDRQKDGYGLTEKIVEKASKKKPDLIITVDNGITSIAGVNAVHALKHPCKILITDHHLPAGEELPKAEAIVNPNQPDCKFPSKALAGCGVMFYVVVALRQRMREKDLFNKLDMKEPMLQSLLDVLALGSIADMMPFDYNNRMLIKMGLDRIRGGRARPGIKALINARGLDETKIQAQDIGFSIAPCINATGRISDGSLAVRTLCASQDEAEELAEHLVDLNEQRRSIQKDMTDDALEFVSNINADGKFSITLYLENAHEGVVGIVAGRIKDMTNRPVICFVDSDKEGIIKGSARSRNPIHIRHLFDEMAARDPEMFVGYGGHAMAAGLSIYKDKLEAFESLLDELCSQQLTEEMIKGDIQVDMMIPGEYLNLETAEVIIDNGPWGMKFEEPMFGAKLKVVDTRVLKDVHLKLTLEDPETGTRVSAISFFSVEDNEVPVEVGNTIDVAFTLSVNEFRGNRTLQLMVRDLQDPELCLKMQKGDYVPGSDAESKKEVNYSKNRAKTSSYSIGM